MSLGYFVFSFVNIFRILLVVHFVEQPAGQANFYWSHDLIGNTILMAVGLGLFVAFIKIYVFHLLELPFWYLHYVKQSQRS